MSKQEQQAPKHKRQLQGTVIKHSGNHTVAVEVARSFQHAKYLKSIKRTKRYLVHDPMDLGVVGDVVTIEETRPISKTKRFILVKKAEKKSK